MAAVSLKASSPSRSATLATLRCLSVLPVHGASGLTNFGKPCKPFEQLERQHYPAPGQVKALHYDAHLRRKVSAAVSRLTGLMQGWEVRNQVREMQPSHIQRATPLQSLDQGNQSSSQNMALQAAPATESDRTQLFANRKRTADEALMTELKPFHEVDPASSSLHLMPRASDGCSAPSDAAAPISQEECGWDGASEATGGLALLSARSGRTSPDTFATGSDAALGEGPAPGHLLRRTASIASNFGPQLKHRSAVSRQYPPQPSGRTVPTPSPPERHDRLIAGASAGFKLKDGQQLSDSASPTLSHLVPSARPGRAPSLMDRCGGISALPIGPGALGVPPQLPLPQDNASLRSSVQFQHQQHSRAMNGPPVAAGWLQPVATGFVSRPLICAPEDSREVSRPQRDPPSLCALPPPSLTLKQLVSRRWVGSETSVGTVYGKGISSNRACGPPTQTQSQLQATHSCAEATCTEQRFEYSAVMRLDTLDSRIRAARDATAAMTASQWHQKLAALPALDVVVSRWSLSAFAEQGTGEAGQRDDDANFPSRCSGSDSVAAESASTKPRRSFLRHVITPLPRRTADALLDVATAQWCGGEARVCTALPLGPLVLPLPGQSCQARDDLWELVRCNSSIAACALPLEDTSLSDGAGAVNSGAAMEMKSTGCLAELPDIAQACAESCCEACGWSPIDREGSGKVDIEDSADDSDVYISSEGLVCLASLAAPDSNLNGWRLPFTVKQREPVHISGELPGQSPPLSNDAKCCCRPGGTYCGQQSRMLRVHARPSALYFAEPLRETPGLLLDSWSRVCGRALANSCGGLASTAASSFQALHDGGVEAEDEDCECCQQDEWQLGGMSLLVLSHCGLGLMDGSHGRRLIPAQLVALTVDAAELSESAARHQAAHEVAHAVSQRYLELACRAELLHNRAATMVVVLDAADGTLLAQHCLDSGALRELAADGTPVLQQADPWRLAHDVLVELRKLPPGPYMLHMNTLARSLELLGTRGGA